MKTIHTSRLRKKFAPCAATVAGQAAMMTLAPGDCSDDELRNEHPRSEQWLLILAGKGSATVVPRGGKARHVVLRPGTLLVIEKGERHQIRNTGQKSLRTINFYLPPAYDANGDVRPRIRRNPRK